MPQPSLLLLLLLKHNRTFAIMLVHCASYTRLTLGKSRIIPDARCRFALTFAVLYENTPGFFFFQRHASLTFPLLVKKHAQLKDSPLAGSFPPHAEQQVYSIATEGSEGAPFLYPCRSAVVS